MFMNAECITSMLDEWINLHFTHCEHCSQCYNGESFVVSDVGNIFGILLISVVLKILIQTFKYIDTMDT